MKEKNIFENIADFCIKEVQENAEPSMGGFQTTVNFYCILAKYSVEINEYINDKICDAISNRKEVANVDIDTDGFDIILYTDYAHNYNKSNL